MPKVFVLLLYCCLFRLVDGFNRNCGFLYRVLGFHFEIVIFLHEVEQAPPNRFIVLAFNFFSFFVQTYMVICEFASRTCSMKLTFFLREN